MLDVIEGIVEGSVTPHVMLQLLLPLLQALQQYQGKLMTPLANRIKGVLRSLRNIKKYNNIAGCSVTQLQDAMDEVFSFAGIVTESCHGVMALLRCGASCLSSSELNKLLDIFLGHAKHSLLSKRVNKLIIIEPCGLDIMNLRTSLLHMMVNQCFMTDSCNEYQITDDINSRSSSEKTLKSHVVWDLLQEIVSKIFGGAHELNEEDKKSVLVIGNQIIKVRFVN